MKKAVVIAAAVLLANVVDINQGVVLPLAAQDQVAEVVAEVKKALGGDKLARP